MSAAFKLNVGLHQGFVITNESRQILNIGLERWRFTLERRGMKINKTYRVLVLR